MVPIIGQIAAGKPILADEDDLKELEAEIPAIKSRSQSGIK